MVVDSINKNQKFTIIGKSSLTPSDAWDVLLAALSSKGFTLIEQGKTWSVVKRGEAKDHYTPFYKKGLSAKNNEEIGTLFYKAQHATPESLKNIAKFLLSKEGVVEVFSVQ